MTTLEPTKIIGNTILSGNDKIYTQAQATDSYLLEARLSALESLVAQLRDEIQDLRETVEDGEVWIGGTESERD